MEYLNFQEANCQNCYKCVRTCQVKAIKITDKQAKIIPELCVGCGECFSICPQNAKSVKTDVELVKEHLRLGKKLVVSLAPSFPSYGNFRHPLQFVSGLKQLGFYRIEETTIGAEKVSEAYRTDYESDQQHIITTSCPTVNFLVSKYYHDKVKYLSKVVSPMMAHNKIIKQNQQDVYTVFVGPCISKKEETKICYSKDSCIDFVITFDDIRDWFEEEKIDVYELEQTKLDAQSTKNTKWYPLSGGVEKASISTYSDRRVIKVDGMNRCIEMLNSLDDISDKTWIEMNACREGCINGFGNITSPLGIHKKIENVINYVNKSEPSLQNIDNSVDIDFDYTKFKQVQKNEYTEEEIKRVLAKTGKFSKQDELNCGACGYNTCRDKAIAVLDHKAELDMCLPYMRMVNEDMSSVIIENTPNGIIVVNNRFEIEEFNPTSVNLFMTSKINAIGKNVEDVIGSKIFHELAAKNSKTTVKKEIFKKIGRTMIVSMKHIDNHDLYLGIFKDITKEEKQKSKQKKMSMEALEMAQEVIDKQMIVAHEIASLLGETTAETKVTLSKFKKLFHDYDQ